MVIKIRGLGICGGKYILLKNEDTDVQITCSGKKIPVEAIYYHAENIRDAEVEIYFLAGNISDDDEIRINFARCKTE